MRVLIIGINYRPELTAIGPYTAGLAEYLASRGDRVTVVTGLPHYPEWRIMRGTPRALVREEQIDGVSVIRAAHYVPTAQSAIRRALYESSFGLIGLIASLRVPRPDAILGVVPSLSGGVLSRLTGGRLRVPYGLLFQDLMGPAAGQSGIGGSTSVIWAAEAAERWATRSACAIGVVAKGFTPYLVSLGVDRNRIHHVPNWSRVSPPSLPAAKIRERFGWTDGHQVVLHAGNIGLKQGLEQVVEAARLAARRGDPVRFVFSGGGNQAAAIRAAAKDLHNVSLIGVQPDGIHASILATADVLLLSERATQIDMSLPSKLTSYFAAGRPILAAVSLEGGSASEVERSGAGLVVPAGEPVRLLDALARLRAEPALAAELAALGPVYAEANTSAAVCLSRAVALIDRIAGRAPVATGRALERAS
jgi:glycosyltransferase involved in cell wall biosynthesis